MSRKYLPTLAELIDRLAIAQLKEVFIVEHKDEYAKEISEITHDIEEILKDDSIRLTGKDVRAIIVLSQMNSYCIFTISLTIDVGVKNSPPPRPSDIANFPKKYS